eukprot:CAMPEP_0113879548 /NCGR_PEP_ID=MMETSP0780_2-20120614/7296_1 /TAXON_ID=652834 /ORGANISM="Palpitomonas bilix" /LENGTH=173 /DNA_ID=CAMNT_0000866135 /DNA_START=63 /DNA_END=584 /DNA_ORIENTATION=+ /assembly_acc=CAM_ASM_000599
MQDLHRAIRGGDMDEVLVTLASIDDASQVFTKRAFSCPLYLAIDIRFWSAVPVLIHAGANVNFRDSWGQCILHHLIDARLKREELERVLSLYLERGGEIDACDTYGVSPLQKAVKMGDKTLTVLLLKHGADPCCPDRQGVTPVHSAARYRQLHILDLLLRQGREGSREEMSKV